MNTRLGHYCERVIEAGWLAAVILTPLYFDVYSSRVFEPDKLTLLRSIALLMGLAWLVSRIERAVLNAQGGAAGKPLSLRVWWRSLTATPLMLSVMLLVLVYIESTLFSIAPRTSFWGSYQRLQGTYTTFSYIIIFFVTWQTLRTKAQLERLLNVIVLTSVPISLYGVLQHYRLDPLPWGGDVVDRVTANLGNAIFIAAYLIMAFFITLERLVARFRRLLAEENSSLADAFMGAAYLFALALQLMTIYFSQSRGPWLGLMAGFYVFMLIALVALRRSAADGKRLRPIEAGKAIVLALLSPAVGILPAYLGLILAKRGRRWLWLSWCIQSILVLAFLGFLNLPNTPLAPLRQVPDFGRLGQIFDTDSGTGRVRVLIWQGAVQLLEANPLRTLIGYGPESMYVAYNPYYPPDLAHYEARNASPDRSHNETFDALITTGMIGFLVYFSLFVGIFLNGLRWLHLIPQRNEEREHGRWQRPLFLALSIGGSALGVLVPLLIDHSLRFAGVGIPVGLILGVAVFLIVSAFARTQGDHAAESFGSREMLLVGLLAMIVAHFVEIHFGIAIATTRVYFWLGLAMLISVGMGALRPEAGPEPDFAPATRPQAIPASRHKRKAQHRTAIEPLAAPPAPSMAAPIAIGLIGALILGTIFVDLTTNATGDPNPFRVLGNALAFIRPAGQPAAFSPGILAMVFLTWILGAMLIVGEAENQPERPSSGWWARALGLYLGISLLGGLIYALFHASQLRGSRDLGLIVYYYYAFALGLVLLAAFFLPGRRTLHAPSFGRHWVWAYPVLALVVGVLVYNNATIVRADIYYKIAWDSFHLPATNAASAHSADQTTLQQLYDSALYYYDRALSLEPHEDYYRLFFGKAFLERATVTTNDPTLQERYLERSEQELLQARAENPLNTDHSANLARLYTTWASVATDPATRQEKQQKALEYYAAAARLSPHNAEIFDEWGEALLNAGQPQEALAKYQQSLALDNRYDQTYLQLGDYYLSQKQDDQALSAYQKAVQITPGLAQAHNAMAYIYSNRGQYADAIKEKQLILKFYPQDYQTNKDLALLYQQTGQYTQALSSATIARQLAPQSDQASLDDLIKQIQASLSQGSQK